MEKTITKNLIVKIFTTKSDKSLLLIKDQTRKLGIKINIFYYENLSFLNGKIFDKGKKIISDGKSIVILRDPFNTGKDYKFYLDYLLKYFSRGVILDSFLYNNFYNYEDKLFQYIHIMTMGLSIPKSYHFNDPEQFKSKKMKFPMIIKKRISSRGRDVFTIKTKKDLDKFLEKKNVCDYILQQYIKPVKDIRIMFVGSNFCGAVERKINTKRDGRIGVKVNREIKISKSIIRDAKKIVRSLRVEFCGIDVIIDKNLKYYFLECNVSPQFLSFERAVQKNVSGTLLEFLINKFYDSR